MLECLLFVHKCVFTSLSFLRVFHVSRPRAFRPARFPSFGVIVVPFRLFNYLSAGFNQSGIGARNAGWPGPRRITTCAEDLSNGASGSTVGICVFIKCVCANNFANAFSMCPMISPSMGVSVVCCALEDIAGGGCGVCRESWYGVLGRLSVFFSRALRGILPKNDMTAKTQNEHHPCSLTFGIPTAPHVLRLP